MTDQPSDPFSERRMAVESAAREERREAAIETADEARWWETYDNIVRMVRHMADTFTSPDVIAHFVEKPYNYTAEYVEMLETEAEEDAS